MKELKERVPYSMRTVNLYSPETFLGIKGDNKAVRVQMDVTDISEGITSGTYTVLFKRADGSIYPVTSSVSSKKVYVTLTATETLYPGRIFFEVQLHDLNDVLIKSKTFSGYIKDSLGEAGDPPNPPGREWVEYISGLVSNAATSVNGKHGVVVLDGRDINVDNSASPVRTIKDAISVIDTKADKTALTATDRRVDALYKLTQGQIWDAEEDTTAAYKKTVLSGAKAVALTKIGGKTIAMNQLFRKRSLPLTAYGVTYTDNGDGGIKMTGSSTASSECSYGRIGVNVGGHKLLIKGSGYPVAEGGEQYIRIGAWTYNGSAFVTNIWAYESDVLIDVPSNVNDLSPVINVSNGVVFGNSFVVYPLIFDLTLMFGRTVAATITTPEQAYALGCPRNYIPYNTGELVSAKVDEIESASHNILPTPVPGTYSGGGLTANVDSSGRITLIDSPSRTSSVFVYITLSDSFTYTGRCYVHLMNSLAMGGIALRMYTNDMTNVFDITMSSITNRIYDLNDSTKIGLTSNKLCVYASGGVNVTGQVFRPMISSLSTAVPYSPYGAISSMDIPSSVLALDGYGKSIVIGHNSIEYDENSGKWWHHKRIGSIDMGSLIWVYQESTPCFYATVNGMKTTSTDVLMPIYTNATVWLSSNDKCYCAITSNSVIYVKDTSYGSDAAAFKTAMNGVILHYELATETVTDITNLMANTDNFLQTETGGTLTFRQQNDTTIPVPNAETYFVQLSEV